MLPEKHAITEDFDFDEDFVIEYECFTLEISPLGASRVGKRVRSVATDGNEVDPIRVSVSPDASLRENITRCSDEVSSLCHTNDVSSLAKQIGDLDDQGNTLERTKELESLLVGLNSITHNDDLEE